MFPPVLSGLWQFPPALHDPQSRAPAPECKHVPSIQLPCWQCVCSVVSHSCVCVFSRVRLGCVCVQSCPTRVCVCSVVSDSCVCVCVQSCPTVCVCVCSVVSDSCVSVFSHVQPFVTPWTAARQAPLSTWTLQARTLEWVASFSSRGSPDPGTGPKSLASPELAGRFFTS